jgi:ribosomal protein L31E
MLDVSWKKYVKLCQLKPVGFEKRASRAVCVIPVAVICVHAGRLFSYSKLERAGRGVLQKRCSKLAKILNCIFKFNVISKTVAVKDEVKSNWNKGISRIGLNIN